MPVTLPSPTFDLIHHQQSQIQFVKKPEMNYLQAKDHSSMQIYSESTYPIVQSSLPVLTPMNLNLKYVEFQSTAGGVSSESDSEGLSEQSKTRAKRNLPHKKRLKKLKEEQKVHQLATAMQVEATSIRVVQANQVSSKFCYKNSKFAIKIQILL